MSTKFSQHLIDITEQAVQNEIATDDLPQISYRDYEDAENGWNIIKNSEKNHYIQFASNGFGYQSFGFYKANNGKIYIIQAYMNNITKVYIPSEKWDCLKNVINDQDSCINKGS